MGGSVLPSLVVMRFEGAGVLSESPALRNQARWFIAHEAAHFWLGQAVSYEFSRDAWITEGGADLLAVRTVAALDPSYDARKALQGSVDECIKLTKDKGVASAQQRTSTALIMLAVRCSA
jgi:aminopeptidase N